MKVFEEYIIPINETAKDYDEMFVGIIRRQPKLVRCKDCKHYKKEIKCVGSHYNGCDWWLDEGCESPVDEDGYCSYAEGKEK